MATILSKMANWLLAAITNGDISAKKLQVMVTRAEAISYGNSHAPSYSSTNVLPVARCHRAGG